MQPGRGDLQPEEDNRQPGKEKFMKEKIIDLITSILQVPEGTITEDTRIEDVEQWDSLAHVMIIGELEDKLGISIPLDEAVELTSVREILEMAETRPV